MSFALHAFAHPLTVAITASDSALIGGLGAGLAGVLLSAFCGSSFATTAGAGFCAIGGATACAGAEGAGIGGAAVAAFGAAAICALFIEGIPCCFVALPGIPCDTRVRTYVCFVFVVVFLVLFCCVLSFVWFAFFACFL